jgi:hypothetical protein
VQSDLGIKELLDQVVHIVVLQNATTQRGVVFSL